MKKMNVCLTVLAMLLLLGAGVKNVWAYFTTYAEAQGGYVIELGDRTQITEEFSDWTKHVVVTLEPDSQPVYVRARAYAPSDITLTYVDASGKWTLNPDGYYYYGDFLYYGADPATASTSDLQVMIDGIRVQKDEEGNYNKELEDGDSFNVIVIYECTPVRYREDGTPYAGWDAPVEAQTLEDEQGGGE